MKTQDEWIAYFNSRKEVMASMPDFYLAGKSTNQKLLAGLKEDFRRTGIITSTRIGYKEGTNAEIIHNYGSTVIQPVEHKMFIPEYWEHPLAAVLDSKEGLRFLQVLFGTSDSAQQIKDTLQKLGNHSLDNILV